MRATAMLEQPGPGLGGYSSKWLAALRFISDE